MLKILLILFISSWMYRMGHSQKNCTPSVFLWFTTDIFYVIFYLLNLVMLNRTRFTLFSMEILFPTLNKTFLSCNSNFISYNNFCEIKKSCNRLHFLTSCIFFDHMVQTEVNFSYSLYLLFLYVYGGKTHLICFNQKILWKYIDCKSRP